MRLLLVEDSPRLQRPLQTGLRRAGYAIDIAGVSMAIEAREVRFYEAQAGGKEMIVTAQGKIKPQGDDD